MRMFLTVQPKTPMRGQEVFHICLLTLEQLIPFISLFLIGSNIFCLRLTEVLRTIGLKIR